jgi:hypothetical protein
MKRIIITLEGGIVQNIGGIPDDVTIEIRDFDTEGVPADELTETEDGKAVVSEWN